MEGGLWGGRGRGGGGCERAGSKVIIGTLSGHQKGDGRSKPAVRVRKSVSIIHLEIYLIAMVLAHKADTHGRSATRAVFYIVDRRYIYTCVSA